MVTLIDDDIIEFLLIKEFERTAHRNIGREQEILTCFLCLRIIQTAGFRATKDLLECLQGFLQDRAFMYDVEQSVWIEIECIECFLNLWQISPKPSPDRWHDTCSIP